jgi:hypothetical protein
VAFVLSLETLMGIVRLARGGDGASHDVTIDGQCPHNVAMSADDAIVAAYLHARDCLGQPVSQRQLSATFGVPRPRVAALVGALNGHGQQTPETTPRNKHREAESGRRPRSASGHGHQVRPVPAQDPPVRPETAVAGNGHLSEGERA